LQIDFKSGKFGHAFVSAGFTRFEMQNQNFLNLAEARAFESQIADPIDQAFVRWAMNRALLRPAVRTDSPQGNFDLLYFAKVMHEISTKRSIAKEIFDGRADELW
jgi:hypothetical protein